MDVWLMNDLLAKPATLSGASKYTVMNGVLYLCAGALLVAWSKLTQGSRNSPRSSSAFR